MRAVIVVPTIREECIHDFLEAWRDEFANHQIIVVEDNPTRTFKIEQSNVAHYAWEEIDRELGEKAWIIPRRTDCIRSFGFYKAYQEQPDMVVTLDDDCYPAQPDFLATHYTRLKIANSEAWVSTGDGIKPRGIPYYQTQRRNECVLNHGLWLDIPDFDAVTQLVNSRHQGEFLGKEQTIPKGMYFPMCGMNIAFKPKVIPALYFLLMGKDYPFDRFGDIWAGIFLKKISDHLGYAINSGSPSVTHKRASNVWANLKKEVPGLEVNESLWEQLDSVILTKENFGACYGELAEKLPMKGEYWDKLKVAMREWVNLFP